MPLVSIIIPVFNREHTLERAVRSAQSQTFSDWDMIIVDDASRDGSLELARKLGAEDSRIRVLALEKNVGANGARNAGIAATSGKWIALLDSDDEWMPRKLEVQLARARQLVEEGRDEPGVVYGGIENRFLNGKRVRHTKNFEGMVFPILLKEFFGYTTTLLIRRDVLEAEPLSASEGLGDEFEFSLRASRKFPYAAVTDIVAIAHIQTDSKQHPLGHVRQIMRHKKDILELYGRRGLGGVYLDNALRYWFIREYLTATYWLLRCLVISPRSAKAWKFLLHVPVAQARKLAARAGFATPEPAALPEK